jgi:hypothetical protein
MRWPAIAMCVAGSVAVLGGLIAAGRYPRHSVGALIAGSVLMWTAFWVEALA